MNKTRFLLLPLLLLAFAAQAAITHVDSTSSDEGAIDGTITGTEPSGAAEDDLIIGFVWLAQDDGNWTDPADFTQIDEQDEALGNPDASMYVGYKVRGATAGNALDWSYSGTDAGKGIILIALRGIDTSTPLDVTYSAGSHYTAGTNSPTAAAPAITTATDGAYVVILQHCSQAISGAAGPPSSYTELEDRFTGVSGGRGGYAAGRLISSASTETPGAYTHVDVTGTADCRRFTIAIKPAASVPTFDTNPTLDACTATGCTFDYDADALADEIHAMFTDTAASAPTCAAIEAETGSHGANGEVTTGSADSITITSTDSPEFPLYDAHFCLEEGTSNYSSVVTVSDNALADPAGEQFIALTSAGTGSPCESFNTAVDPDIVSGDYLLANDNTDPGVTGTHDGSGNAATLTDSTASWTTDVFAGLTIDNDTDGSSCTVTGNTATTVTCTLAGGTENDWDAADAYTITTPATISVACQYSFAGDGSRQSVLNTEVYDASAGAYHASDIDAWFNNSAPVCEETDVLLLFEEDVAASNVDLDTFCTDAESDTLTYSLTAGTLPTGMSLSGANSETLGGTPTTEDEAGAAVTFTATDLVGDTDTFTATIYVVNTWTMVDITGNTLVEAEGLILAAAPWYEDELVFITSLTCDAAVAANDIISSTPAASAEVGALDDIAVTLSTGPACALRRRR